MSVAAEREIVRIGPAAVRIRNHMMEFQAAGLAATVLRADEGAPAAIS